ncbi:hypothetical protein AVEN_221702-1 [Araneus ventricosus]|uniref:Uncharacterized protein n=1 Tax=Araneus ventricosus TaxID=182803 RepID=A0A4Y2KNI1_ARAVE|nr:hypothetical protein AVEN_221702-1 [Araneus ventricosus]
MLAFNSGRVRRIRFLHRHYLSGIPTTSSNMDSNPENEEARHSGNFLKLPDHLQIRNDLLLNEVVVTGTSSGTPLRAMGSVFLKEKVTKNDIGNKTTPYSNAIRM